MTTSTLRGALEARQQLQIDQLLSERELLDARQRQKRVNFLASQNASAELTSLHARQPSSRPTPPTFGVRRRPAESPQPSRALRAWFGILGGSVGTPALASGTPPGAASRSRSPLRLASRLAVAVCR